MSRNAETTIVEAKTLQQESEPDSHHEQSSNFQHIRSDSGTVRHIFLYSYTGPHQPNDPRAALCGLVPACDNRRHADSATEQDQQLPDLNLVQPGRANFPLHQLVFDSVEVLGDKSRLFANRPVL